MNGATQWDQRRTRPASRAAQVVGLTLVLMVLVAVVLWMRGAGFYVLALGDRVEHEDFATLGPSRPVGRTYGAVGLGLMLLNLLYLARRRFARVPLGRMQVWLDVHVATGLLAALFVAFHSAFQLRSVVAQVMTATLAVTVATGLVGRFFHALVPRSGRALSGRVADLGRVLTRIEEPLRCGLAAHTPSEAPPGSGLVRVLGTVPRWWREARARRALVHATVQAACLEAEPLECIHALPIAAEVAQLAVREVYAVAGRELLRAWRPWHRLCALIMVAGVLLHVGVALFYGYAWDFAGWDLRSLGRWDLRTWSFDR